MIADEVLNKLVSKESSIEEGVLDYYWVICLLEGYSYEYLHNKLLFSDGSYLDLKSTYYDGRTKYTITGKKDNVIFYEEDPDD